MNSEARKRAAGIAASNPTDPEHEGAPGADSEALAASRPDLVGVILFARWPDGDTTGFPTRRVAELIADAVLASSWLADHDRQIAAAAWFAGYDKGNLDGYFGTSHERAKSPYSDLDPYSEEARRG